MKNDENGKKLIFLRVFGWVNEKVEEFFFFFFFDRLRRKVREWKKIVYINLLICPY